MTETRPDLSEDPVCEWRLVRWLPGSQGKQGWGCGGPSRWQSKCKNHTVGESRACLYSRKRKEFNVAESRFHRRKYSEMRLGGLFIHSTKTCLAPTTCQIMCSPRQHIHYVSDYAGLWCKCAVCSHGDTVYKMRQLSLDSPSRKHLNLERKWEGAWHTFNVLLGVHWTVATMV